MFARAVFDRDCGFVERKNGIGFFVIELDKRIAAVDVGKVGYIRRRLNDDIVAFVVVINDIFIGFGRRHKHEVILGTFESTAVERIRRRTALHGGFQVR